MKLLCISEFFYPDNSSTPKVLTELAEDLMINGLDIEVITSNCLYRDKNIKIRSKEIYKNIKIRRIWSTKGDRNVPAWRLINYVTFLFNVFLKVLFKTDYDCILLVSNPPLLPIIGYLANKLYKKSFVYLVHDIYPDVAVKIGIIKEGSLTFKIMDRINRIIFNSASKIVVLGRDMKRVLVNKGVDEHKVHIITNWADSKKIYRKSKVNSFSEIFGISNTFNVIYTGNIGRFHDIETILKCAKTMEEYKDVRFLFVGDGYKRKLIERYIGMNSLDNILLCSYKYGEDYNDVLNSADIFVTSLDVGIEGLGVPSKTYSYLAAGKPIIAIMNNCSEIGSMVEEKELGLRVNSGEKDKIVEYILKLKNNPNIVKDISNRIDREFKSNYDRQIVTGEFYNLLSKGLTD